MNLFTQIEQIIPQCHGWCTVERAKAMASAVIALRRFVSVTVGVWGGRDVIALALAHKEVSRGKVIGIDPWSAEASVEGQTGENLAWWRSVDHELVYQDCLARIKASDVSEFVEIIRKKSDDVTPPTTVGVLVVDGNHSDAAIRDVDRYAANVVVGGLIFADDLKWDGGGVQRAVKRLNELGCYKLYDLDAGAVFQRIRE